MKRLHEIWVLFRCVWRHPANRSSPSRALGRLVLWQFWKRFMRSPVLVDVLGARWFLVWPDSPYSSLVLYNRLPDWDELGLLRRVARRGEGFLDIGANVGFYSVVRSALGSPGRIISIDPNPRNVSVLRAQKRLNDIAEMEVHALALGATEGEVLFDTSSRETGSVQTGGSGSTDRVACRRLDDLMAGSSERFVAKMDVEGFECQVLAGAVGSLGRKNIWLWIFEVNPPALAAQGASASELLKAFSTAGYALLEYSEETRQFASYSGDVPASLCNLIACSDPDLLRQRLDEASSLAGVPL